MSRVPARPKRVGGVSKRETETEVFLEASARAGESRFGDPVRNRESGRLNAVQAIDIAIDNCFLKVYHSFS